MKSAGKARNNGLYRHIRTSKEIIRNLLNDSLKNKFVTVIDKLNHYFLIIYTTAWIFSATLAPEHFWSVITMCDKVQITFSLLGILSCIYSFVKK